MALPQRSRTRRSTTEMPSGYGSTPVPGAKEPKTRPPRSLRDKLGLLHAHLPYYSGPYSVGTMEIEVPARDPRHFSDITRHKRPLLQLDTVLMTVFYPAAHGSGSGTPPYGGRRWSRETWLPRPRVETARGYGRFAGIGSMAVPLFATTSMFTKLPAFRNAKLATHWPPPFNLHTGGAEVKHRSAPAPADGPAHPVFSLMMFSHGLGGTRTMYSELCGEFASYGFIVVAVEHRDGSGPRSFVNKSRRRSDAEEPTTIDYVFPKGNAMDTAPNNDRGVDVELRAAQLALRLAEVEEAYHLMCQIAQGDGKSAVYDENLRRKGTQGASSIGLDGVDWDAWKGAFHTDKVTLLGHSFGAATVVEALRQPDRFQWLGQAVIYDIWGAAVQAADKFAESQAASGDSQAADTSSPSHSDAQDTFDANQSKAEKMSGPRIPSACKSEADDTNSKVENAPDSDNSKADSTSDASNSKADKSNSRESHAKSTPNSAQDNVDEQLHDKPPAGSRSQTGPISLPMLAINSEAFSYWASNYELVQSLAREAAANGQPAWLLTVRGTVHVSHSDFALLYPRLCSLFLKMTANARRALDITVEATLEFLQLVAPRDRSTECASRAGHDSGILAVPLLRRDDDDQSRLLLHRPRDKYIAARLRIPHELSYRLRRRGRWVAQRRGSRDGQAATADEVWMHVKPSLRVLQTAGLDVGGDDGRGPDAKYAAEDCQDAAGQADTSKREAADDDTTVAASRQDGRDAAKQTETAGRETAADDDDDDTTTVAAGTDASRQSAEEQQQHQHQGEGTVRGRLREATAGGGAAQQ